MTQTAVWNRWLWLTLFVSFGLRLGLAFAVQHEVSKPPGRLCLIAGDAEGYWELAGRLAAGEPYSIYDPPRRLLRMPGFPFLLALPRMIFGDRPFAARILLVLVGTLACLLTYQFGKLLAGPRVGVIAMAFTALNPTMALFSVLFLSETSFAAAMMGSLIVAAKLLRVESSSSFTTRPLINVALLCGSLVGVATYMRPTWLLVGPALALLVVFLGRQSLQTRLILATAICTSLGLTLAPWTIRNAMITGHLIPTTLWVGPSLYDGLSPDATGDSDMTFFERDQLMSSMSEYEMDREYRRRAWSYAAAHPDRVLQLAAIKQIRFWSPAPNTAQFNNRLVHFVAWLVYLPLMCFALIGAWFSRRDLTLLLLTVAPLLYFAALHLLFVGSLRYRLPAEYPLAVLASIGLVRITHRERTRTEE